VCTDRCVCYVEAWCAPIGVSVMWRPGVHRSVCLLCGGLVCTDLSGYLAFALGNSANRLADDVSARQTSSPKKLAAPRLKWKLQPTDITRTQYTKCPLCNAT
jgi:hypothetical protein